MTGFMTQGGGSLDPLTMRALLAAKQSQGMAGPQMPQQLPNGVGRATQGTSMTMPNTQMPAQQPNINPMAILGAGNTARNLTNTASGSNPWSVPGWMSNMFSTPTQSIGSTPYGGDLSVPQSIGQENVGGGLGESSYLTQNPYSTQGADLGNFMAGGGGQINSGQAGMWMGDGMATSAPTDITAGAAGTDAGAAGAATEGGAAAGTAATSDAAASELGSTEASAGPWGWLAALITAGKVAEYQNPGTNGAKGLLSALGPSAAQINTQPMLGVTTAAGAPWMNGFIENDSAANTAPEWLSMFS